MTKIGWIGSGNFGQAIVSKLLAEGFNVSLHNRTEANAKNLIEKGARWCASPQEVAYECNIIFLCLGSISANDNILWDHEHNLSLQLGPDHLIIDLSTTSPEYAISLAKELFEKTGSEYLECPVSGGVEGAISGELASIIAGNIDAYRRCEKILSVFINKVTFVEQRGRAQRLKILNNLIESINLCGALEVLSAGENLGLTISEMESVFMSCRAKSAYMQVALNYLKSDSKSTGVSLNIRCKDLQLASDEIEISKYPLAYQASLLLLHTNKIVGSQGDQCDYYKLIPTNIYHQEIDNEA